MPLTAFATAELDGGEPDTEEESEASQEEAAEVKTLQAKPTTFSELLNQTDLTPADPRSAALDELIEDIFDEILNSEMDPYEQVRACYDYLVDTVSYGSHTSYLGTPIGNGVTCGDVYSAYGEVEGFGAVALTARVGMCNAYNAAFILMVRKLGYDATLVEGGTKSRGGGYAYHKWTEMEVDGQVYVFDPQLEQDLVKAGLPAYSVFGKTYEQIPGRYIKY